MAAKLPKFIDKNVYVENDKDNKTISRSISSSYIGILRISPNNYDSLSAVNNANTIDTKYIDKPDDFIPNNNSINNLLQVSDSEGYMLDLKVGINKIRSNTVYVLGAATCNRLVINGNGNKCFTINKINHLPCFTNKNTKQRTTFDFSYDVVDLTDKNVDNVGIVMNISNSSSERVFGYKNISNTISELVKKKIEDVSTLPTGSVYFVPISISQYNNLDSDHPFKTEFLVCDGSRHLCSNYSKLADIISGTQVDYDTNSNGVTTISRKYKNPTDGYFRVPDLRHKFIKSVWLEKSSKDYSKTGLYSPDFLPEKFTNESTSEIKDESKLIKNHFHFIASAIRSSDFKRSIPGDGQIWNTKDDIFKKYNGDIDNLQECIKPKYGENNEDDESKGIIGYYTKNSKLNCGRYFYKRTKPFPNEKKKYKDMVFYSDENINIKPSVIRLATDGIRGYEAGEPTRLDESGNWNKDEWARNIFWHQPNYTLCTYPEDMPHNPRGHDYCWRENGYNANFFFSQKVDAVNNSDGTCKYKANAILCSTDIDLQKNNSSNSEEINEDDLENCPQFFACLPLIKI